MRVWVLLGRAILQVEELWASIVKGGLVAIVALKHAKV